MRYRFWAALLACMMLSTPALAAGKATGRARAPAEAESLEYLSPPQALDRARRGEHELTRGFQALAVNCAPRFNELGELH